VEVRIANQKKKRYKKMKRKRGRESGGEEKLMDGSRYRRE
jgi:hypothetical protein